jgi:tRNA pseudouridine38-40 synthase
MRHQFGTVSPVPRIAFSLEYHGKRFHGSQLQLGVRTVQGELESAFEVLAKQPLRVTLSGRTDAGVHAAGQCFHVDWPEGVIPAGAATAAAIASGLEPGEAAADLDLWRLMRSLNGIMKNDIAVSAAQIVPESFHARFSANRREYVYRILNRQQRSALLKDTHYHVPYELDVKAMQDGALPLLGQHDFAAFRSSNAEQVSTICTISRSEILQLDDGRLEIWIAADRFVYNMVRIIAGTLTEIGLGKRTLESLETALEKGDRDLSGPTAPPWGLTFQSVRYPKEYNLFELNSFDEKAQGVLP